MSADDTITYYNYGQIGVDSYPTMPKKGDRLVFTALDGAETVYIFGEPEPYGDELKVALIPQTFPLYTPTTDQKETTP